MKSKDVSIYIESNCDESNSENTQEHRQSYMLFYSPHRPRIEPYSQEFSLSVVLIPH